MKFFHQLKKNKIWLILILLLFIASLVINGYLISIILKFVGVANLLRYAVIGFIVVFLILLLFFSLRKVASGKKTKILLLIVFYIIYNLLMGYITYNVVIAYNKLDSLTVTEKTYSTSLISLIDYEYDLSSDKIGILSDEESIEGYQIGKEMISENDIDENNIRYYDSYISILEALYNNEIQLAFLPTNYAIMFSSLDNYENLNIETKTILTKEETVVTELAEATSLTEPFTILLMGVDSETENISEATFNGDALILLTVNPNTLSVTMLSIPRDTYVPIACFAGERSNKITHAAWYGEDCMMDTITNFTGIEIDYYVKINFKGVVNLVDSLGGIEVEVPYSFCEQNSDRLFGENTVYVEEGLQLLDGEQTLALARNRHANPDYCSSEWTDYVSNDFIRGDNQQLIIEALLEKAKTIKSLSQLQELLDVLTISMETNLQTSEIFSLYEIGMDVLAASSDAPIDEIITINRLTLSGIDAMIYDFSSYNSQGTQLTLYNFVTYSGSVNDVAYAMNYNLGLVEEEEIKTFSFNAEVPYEETIIGDGYYNETPIVLLPDFTGYTESEALYYTNKYNISLTIEYIEESLSNQSVGTVHSQSLNAKMDLDAIDKTKGITLTIVKESTVTQPLNCMDEENSENSSCSIPTFIGETVSFTENWFKTYSQYSFEVIFEGDYNDDSIIATQSNVSGYIYDLLNNTITFTVEESTVEENIDE